MAKNTNHSARLRRDIDQGRTKDKVDFPDPAAAPLGTDDEASGFPPTEAQVRRARRAELSRRSEAPPPEQPEPGFRREKARGYSWRVAGGLGAVIVLLLIIFAIAL